MTDTNLAKLFIVINIDDCFADKYLTFRCMKDKEYLKRIAANIKKIRKEKGIRQVDLAYSCGFEKQNMQRIESAKTSPTLKTLLRISEALEVDIRDLIVSNIE